MLTIKWVQVRKREDVITVGLINYIVAAVCFLPEFLISGESSTTVNSIWTGSMMGACYFIAFFFVVYVIKWIGAAAATVIASLSLLMPIICGVYIWGENPNSFQIFGVGLSLVALAMIGGKQKEQTVSDSPNEEPASYTNRSFGFVLLILVLFFLLCGLSRLAQEAFKHVCDESERPTFIVTAFTVAAIPSMAFLIYRRKQVSLNEIVFGTIMGVANVLQTHFILKSLDLFDGFIVFPVVGAGGLILTAVVATGLLGERISTKSKIGIGIACVALVLLNWIPGSS